MAYGEIKVDTVTFTDGGIDKSVSISGLVQNPTFSGNITVTGTISGNTVQGQTVSGATVTGTTANFVSGVFTTQISGATITGNVGSFTTITGGTVTLTSGVFASGTAAAPSVSIGTTDNGLYSPGADQVAVATNGTGRLFVDASGNVGVGTSSVNALLEVNNSTAGGEVQRIEGNYDGSGSVILTNWRRAGGSVAAALKYNDDSSPLCMSIGTTTSHEFRIRTADTDAITIDASQRVGIGTSAPGSRLEIGGDASYDATITFNRVPVHTSNDGVIGELFFQNNADSVALIAVKRESAADDAYIQFATQQTSGGLSEKVRITSAGLVGIGNSSPGSFNSFANNLVVGTGTGANGITIYAGNTSTSVLNFADGTSGNDLYPGYIVYNHADDSLSFIVNYAGSASARMFISSAGNVGIGTTSPLTKFVASNGGAEGIELAPAYSAGNNFTFHINRSGSAYVTNSQVASAHIFRISSDVTEAARIDSSGRLLVGTSTYRTVGTYGYEAKTQIEGTSSVVAGLTLTGNRNDGLGPYFVLGRSRGTTAGSSTAVQNGDELGTIQFCGADGTDLETAGALIRAEVDGTPGANDMPGRLVFSTTADGASSPTERLRITSAGLVGIGTSSPNVPLDIESSAGTAVKIRLASNTSNRALAFSNAAETIGWTVGNGVIASARQFVVYDNEAGAARLLIDSSGRVGIGTTSPGGKLDVRDAGTTIPALGAVGTGLNVRRTDGAIGLIIGYENAVGGSYIQAQHTNGSAAAYPLYLQPNGGNVGIGTTAPSSLLELGGVSNPQITLNGTTASGQRGLIFSHAGTAYGQIGQNMQTGEMRIRASELGQGGYFITLGTNGTESARIDSSGRLLVGTSSVISNGYGGTSGLFQVAKNDFVPIGFFTYTSAGADGYCPYLELNRARGTQASPSAVLSGDELGEINFYGHDGSTFIRGASIRSYVDGTPGTNDMPGRLVFSTTADGASSYHRLFLRAPTTAP
jgi:hypothetical protein